MLRDRATRRVATVLFVDIVDSTRIAAEAGDARWRELVAAFRTAVRRQLGRLGGHEVDTAGDGFFATFDEPAAALRAAAAIVREVQSLGLDVRCGLHTGELERIDGRLGGIAAHIGARVLAKAQPAQVLTTGTVREIVVGGAVAFEAIGETELKGVPGRWAIHRVLSVAGEPLPAAMAAEEAALRRAAAHGRPERIRPRALAISVAGLAVAAVALIVATRGDPDNAARLAGPSSPSMSGSPGVSIGAATPPISLVRIDPITRAVAGTVTGDEHLRPLGPAVMMVDGNLWTHDGVVLVRRDPETGEPISEPIELPPETSDVEQAFGYLWVGHGTDQHPSMIDKLNPINGRQLDQVDPGEMTWDFAVGDETLFLATRDEEILEVDPNTADIVDRDPTGTEHSPAYIGFMNGLLSLCECALNRYSLFDPETDRVVGVFEGPGLAYGGGGAIDPATGLVWVGDRPNSTVTPYDFDTREPGRTIGLAGKPRGMAFGFTAVWVAAERFVYRIDSFTHQVTEIAMPEGVTAVSIALDEETFTIWVSSCAAECEEDDG